MEQRDPLELAQLIVRGSYINISLRSAFFENSGIYRFTNEDIFSYYDHLKNKEKVLTVIGSGGQIINGILAGTRDFDCFDISVFPEYYLQLQLASIKALSKEDYLKYYFSDNRDELFGDDFYDYISDHLEGKYKEFWDTLYMFDEGYDIYSSLLFRSDPCMKGFTLNVNPYLQGDNYEKLRQILKTEEIRINPVVRDIHKTSFDGEYDLVNLSNILAYRFKEEDMDKTVAFMRENFKLRENGEVINYCFDLKRENEDKANILLQPNGYVETLVNPNEPRLKKKLMVYKK